MNDPLQDLREQLDAIDHRILQALGERFAVCRQIGEHKALHGIAMMQPGRVQVVQNRATAAARQHGYSEAFALDLYRLIVGEACRQEDELIAARKSLSTNGSSS